MTYITVYTIANGGWSAWTTYTPCTANCGPATKTRYRACTSPSPRLGGLNCVGGSSQTVDCEQAECNGKY